MSARVFNFFGYCLFVSFMLRCVVRMFQGQVLAGGVMLALSIVALIVWCWYKRPVSWGKIMLESTVKGYNPEKARKIVAAFCAEDRQEFAKSTELLWLALQAGNTQGAELLLELGMDINANLPPYASETSVLQTFCIEPEPDMNAIRFLLRHGANPDAGLSFPPMINALAWGNEELVQLLLSHGATPGGMDRDINPSGTTPLHSLCSLRTGEEKEKACRRIKELLQSGADVNALTAAGHTPLDVALEVKGDEDKPLNDRNPVLPLPDDAVTVLREHGALRGSQVRCPNPRFCGRVLLSEHLPEPGQLKSWCGEEPSARVEAVNHAWQGEGLGALVENVAMTPEEKRAILAHSCYVEISLEEAGAVPLDLLKRWVLLMCRVAQAPGCVGLDFGNMAMPARHAADLAETPELAYSVQVQVESGYVDGVHCAVTNGMESLGMPEIVCDAPDYEMSVKLMMGCILPLLLEFGTCLGHHHRAFVTPKLSLVGSCETDGPGGCMRLRITPDYTHYRD